MPSFAPKGAVPEMDMEDVLNDHGSEMDSSKMVREGEVLEYGVRSLTVDPDALCKMQLVLISKAEGARGVAEAEAAKE